MGNETSCSDETLTSVGQCVLYLRVRGRSMLNVELQSFQRLLLFDEVCGVQSHILVEDLKVLMAGVCGR